MRFIDLFAGLGGFHLALSSLGHECVFASEVNPDLQKIYAKNFKIAPAGDIRSVNVSEIPAHDILCAGFPCQPFSKAGEQQGFECPKWGDLFDFVLETIQHHRPRYFILENVPNIKKHDEGKTWRAIVEKLRTPEWGYDVDPHGRLSPHHFGIPQIRDRIFIVGSREGLTGFQWPAPNGKVPSLGKILDRNPVVGKGLPNHYIRVLDVWQEFLDEYPAGRKLPSFPIWSMEFGADYPYEETTPHALLSSPEGLDILRGCRGSHGQTMVGFSADQIRAALPSYALTKDKIFPKWKIQFIRQNRELYEALRPQINEWLPKITHFSASLQKLEWNYQEGTRDIWKHVLQIRASGVRVKKPTTAPSLVAMTTTQIPIVGRSRESKRFMTAREAARLQSMHKLRHLPPSEGSAYQAIGNAVNVEVVRRVASALFGTAEVTQDDMGAAVERRPQTDAQIQLELATTV